MTAYEVRNLAAKFSVIVPDDNSYEAMRRRLKADCMRRLRAQRRAEGLCIHCGRRRSKKPGRTTCDACKS